MRTLQKVVLAVAASAIVVAAVPSALAAPMDPATDRLFLEPGGVPAASKIPAGGGSSWCQYLASHPNFTVNLPKNNKLFPWTGKTPAPQLPNNYPCVSNNSGWANMMSELGYAIAPSAFHPARTTGFGGFALSLEGSYAHINADNTDANGVQYWHQGTQGATQPSGAFGTSNTSPDSIIQVYSLKARKGLPFGFEITGALGLITNTTLWVGGADLHWAVLEGYRTGILGYLPDIAIGGGVRTLSGQQSFYLTTVGIDAQISKPIALADSAVLTPYLGAQRLIIYANSALVNLTPGVDAMAQCGYQGNNVQGNPSAPGNPNTKSNATKNGTWDGSPVCGNKLANGAPDNADFNNQTVFTKQQFYRWRGIGGLTYRYELLWVAGQFAMDMEDPSAENGSLQGGAGGSTFGLSGARQWTLSLETGVFF